MKHWLILLAVVGPLAVICHLMEVSPLLTFALSAASLVPLGALMERSTDELADHLGPTLGGLLNATLGNAPELIIACMALSKGLQDVVKASIAGSILGNLLFANGLAMAIGGWGRAKQRFSHENAGLNSGLLYLAVTALVVPAMFEHTTDNNSVIGNVIPATAAPASVANIEGISFQVAIVLIVVYLISLVYIMTQPKQPHPALEGEDAPAAAEGTPWKPLGMLLLVTLGVAFMSEILTDAIDPTAKALGLSTTFTGVFLLASAGNLAQTYNAIQFARADNMELTLSTTVGSSTQVALLVAPVLVFVGLAVGNPIDLVFSKLELFGLLVATVAVRNTTSDGVSNWMEGVLLVGVYALLGIAFFAA